MHELIVRIAARGDGVTQSGRHVSFGVPGDVLLDDGGLAPGPHHQDAPCRHFPECGGCQLQHVDDEAYGSYLVSRIETALAQHDIDTTIRGPHLSPPRSRRRATLRAVRAANHVVLGFNGEKSHRIIDIRECHILRPQLFAVLAPLRELLATVLPPRHTAEIQLTLVDQGVDVVLKNVKVERLAALEKLTSFASEQGLARLSIDQGIGAEVIYQPDPVTISMAGTPVAFPVSGFLQATGDGEIALIACVREAIDGARSAADLFAGLGTFGIALRTTYGAEASRDAVAALKVAAPSMRVEHRDLYRRPLDVSELERFDAVILDPPRAGAAEQVRALAQSTVRRVAYISCNPSTFARDASRLTEGGYALEWVRPVGQFRWSTHVELAACFSRGG